MQEYSGINYLESCDIHTNTSSITLLPHRLWRDHYESGAAPADQDGRLPQVAHYHNKFQ